MLKGLFSSPIKISIFLLTIYLVLVILANLCAAFLYTLFGDKHAVVFVAYMLLAGLSALYPVLFTISTYILVPRLYRKFGFWSCEARPMLIFSIGMSGILGGILAALYSALFGEEALLDMSYFYTLVSWGGQSFWLTLLLQSVAFSAKTSKIKVFLNKLSSLTCLVSFLLLFVFPTSTIMLIFYAMYIIFALLGELFSLLF